MTCCCQTLWILLAHSLDNVGSSFETTLVDKFCQRWVTLLGHSPAARIIWKSCTGVAPVTFSATRWWSSWEVLHQLVKFFGDVRPFLAERHFSPRTCQHLKRILDDEGTCQSLKLELAVCNDGAEPFVKKTYLMTGDSNLSYHAYKWLQEVLTAGRPAYHPNVEAVVKEIARDDQKKCH